MDCRIDSGFVDKKEVWSLTSLHHADIVETRKIHYHMQTPVTKPTCIQDYNRYMGAVDKTDMVISTIECVRKNKQLEFATFHLRLIKQIFRKYLQTSNTYEEERNSDSLPSYGETFFKYSF
ncbi:hypothetical protein PV325_000641 [Microctonus aethiopoides]|nr:hypothetical protein PV325_000641 [Microctonus aethiopoides]